MNVVALLFWIAAAVVFLIATIPVASRINLVALGLLLLTLGAMIEDLARHHPIHF